MKTTLSIYYLPGISTDGLLTIGDDGSDIRPPIVESSEDPLSRCRGDVRSIWAGTVKGICFMLQGNKIREWYLRINLNLHPTSISSIFRYIIALCSSLRMRRPSSREIVNIHSLNIIEHIMDRKYTSETSFKTFNNYYQSLHIKVCSIPL